MENEITTSQTTGHNKGIYADLGQNHSVELVRNKFKTGNLANTTTSDVWQAWGVQLSGGPGATKVSKIHDNLIISGDTVANDVNSNSWGIDIDDVPTEIRNNTVKAGVAKCKDQPGSTSTALRIRGNGSNLSKVENNIFITSSDETATSRGIEIATPQLSSLISSLKNNAFQGNNPDGKLVNDYTVIGNVNGAENDWSDNIGSPNANLGLDANFKPTSSTLKAGIDGKAKGRDFGGEYLDLDRKPRTAPWTIGAYQ